MSKMDGMSKKVFLMVLVLFFALCANGEVMTGKVTAPSQDKKTEQAQAIAMLKEFYTSYIRENAKMEVDFEALDALEAKCLSEELIDRLSGVSLEYDPFLDAQDVDESWVKTLTVKPVEGQDDAYKVCYRYDGNEPETCVTLFLIKQNGRYLINDILDLENAIMEGEDEDFEIDL